jgi:hypothetical protein
MGINFCSLIKQLYNIIVDKYRKNTKTKYESERKVRLLLQIQYTKLWRDEKLYFQVRSQYIKINFKKVLSSHNLADYCNRYLLWESYRTH